MDVWNQVFRIRHGPRPTVENSDESLVHGTPPPVPKTLPLNLTSYSDNSLDSSESEGSELENGDQTPLEVTVEKPGSLARGDWEKFQSKVSRQLLARYFYSCKFMMVSIGPCNISMLKVCAVYC